MDTRSKEDLEQTNSELIALLRRVYSYMIKFASIHPITYEIEQVLAKHDRKDWYNG